MNRIRIPQESFAHGICGENAIWYVIAETMYIEGFGPISEKLYDIINAFSIRNVTIGLGITEIGQSTFSALDTCSYYSEMFETVTGNNSLENLSIPNTVVNIGACAFAGCTGLKSVVLPESVKKIGDSVFEGCTSLNTVVLPDGLENIGMCAFKDCKSLVLVNIPDSVEYIGCGAFWLCRNLAKIILSCNITYIDDMLFKGCTNLVAVYLPPQITEIGYEAFCDCYSIRELRIPQSTTYIDEAAFKNCSSLEMLVIPENVRVIEGDAFVGCSGIEFLEICSPQISLPQATGFSPLQGVKKVKLSDSITKMPGYMFYDFINLEAVHIPDSVTSIGRFAFYGCAKLKEIQFPQRLEIIGENAFAYCKDLKELTICSNKVDIGEAAFFGCSSLQIVRLGDSVRTIGDAAFCQCTALKTVFIGQNLVEIGKYAFWGCSSLPRISLSSPNVKYGLFAFEDTCQITPEYYRRRMGGKTANSNNNVIREESFLVRNIRESDSVLWFDYQDELQLTEMHLCSNSKDFVLCSKAPEIGKTYIIAGEPNEIGEIFSVVFFPDQRQSLWNILDVGKISDMAIVCAKVISITSEELEGDNYAYFDNLRNLKVVQVINSIKLENLLQFPTCKARFHFDKADAYRYYTLTENSNWQVHYSAGNESYTVAVVYVDENKRKHLLLYGGSSYGGDIEVFSAGNIVDEDF